MAVGHNGTSVPEPRAPAEGNNSKDSRIKCAHSGGDTNDAQQPEIADFFLSHSPYCEASASAQIAECILRG